MSYVTPIGPNSRLKIYKVAVSTPEDKVVQNKSDFNYEVILPYTITDVVGIALVEWSFPKDIIPSFYPTTTKLTGNEHVDFRLANTDIAAGFTDFTMEFPTKFLTYSDPSDSASSYIEVLSSLMNEAINANPVWAGKVKITVLPQVFLATLIVISNIDITLPSTTTTTMTLLFASGPNSATSAHLEMGWPVKADYVSSSTLFYVNTGSQAFESPAPTQLRAAKYLDVSVKESSLRPLQRIFVRDSNYVTNIFSTEGINRFTIDTDNPARILNKLHISLRYEGEGDPGDFIGKPILIPHAMTFHIISLVDENHANPSYVKQSLTY
jgi:hypothetical protein